MMTGEVKDELAKLRMAVEEALPAIKLTQQESDAEMEELWEAGPLTQEQMEGRQSAEIQRLQAQHAEELQAQQRRMERMVMEHQQQVEQQATAVVQQRMGAMDAEAARAASRNRHRAVAEVQDSDRQTVMSALRGLVSDTELERLGALLN